ncbi:MAG: ABC transporter permease [Chloroflexota bacterium]|nr:MAG: ABC transporter permease [Chloroflexota bacterium]
MARFALAKAIQAVIALLAVSVIVFLLTRASGNPLDLMLDDYATAADRQVLAHHLGLDRPLAEQYGTFLWQSLHGDFGASIRAQRPAMDLVMERLPNSLGLAAFSLAISLIIALPVGVYSAVYRGGPLDAIGRIAAVLGQSLPLFWLGLILMLVFAAQLRWLPSAGMSGFSSYILPGITTGWFTAAGLMRLVRTAMLDVLGTEYVKLARAKGVPEFTVIWKHALKNALIPVVTFAAMLFVSMVSAAVVTETVFAWPGVGKLVIDAVQWRDYTVVQAAVIVISAMYIVTNFLIDLSYAHLNPKIRYE